MDIADLHAALSQIGKKGYKGFKEKTTEEQRQAWRKKGGEATRRKFKKEKNEKKSFTSQNSYSSHFSQTEERAGRTQEDHSGSL